MTFVRRFGVLTVGLILVGALASNAAVANSQDYANYGGSWDYKYYLPYQDGGYGDGNYGGNGDYGYGGGYGGYSQPIYLDQGWTDAERKQFYSTPQGSYLIPYNWFLALEQPYNTKLFNNPKHIERIGYLLDEQAYEVSNPDGLPIGFAKEPLANGEAWLGYTCAACHTGEVRFRGKTIRVDGAPTLADFTQFNGRLVLSLRETLNRPPKFERFADRVLIDPSYTSKEALRTQVADQLSVMEQILQRSTPDLPFGHGRIDALGIIMNEVFVRHLQQPTNVRVPNAPVSYPYLWETPQLDFVEWNGSVNNPYGRNMGEVLGTFGRVVLTGPIDQIGTTTARARELLVLERLITKLKSPKWPEDLLGKIDTKSAARGLPLYKANCESCHALRDANGQYPMTPAEENFFGVQFVETTMTPLAEIGTDPLMAVNFMTRTALTGALAPLLPAPFTGATMLPGPVLLNVAAGLAARTSIAGAQPPFSAAERAELIGYRVKAPGLPPYAPKNLAAYKAGPIAGIWATAPYLHNGSVPNLFQLLLPSAERVAKFEVDSSYTFNAKTVGYVPDRQRRAFRFNTALPGNSNAGHDYGTELTNGQRWDLLEFLKTL